MLGLAAIEFLLAVDEFGGQAIELLLTPDGPLFPRGALALHPLAMLMQLGAKHLQFFALARQVHFRLAVLVGQPGAELRQRRRDVGAGSLASQAAREFLGRQPHL